MAHFIDFSPGDILEAFEGYKTYVYKKADLEPSRNVFKAVIEEMCRYCEDDEDCVGRLQAAMGMDYLALYTEEGEPCKEKVKTFTKAIHALLAAENPPWFVQGGEVESYYSELQEIAEYLENRKK